MKSTTDPRTSYQDYLNTRYFSCLDGLRFICIAAVVFHHSPLVGALAPGFTLASRGFLGVDFFFVISGFLITTLLLREERRHGRFSLPGFYKRRTLRILPVYFLVITAVGGYYAVVRSDPNAADIWIYYYLFLSNFLTSDIPTLGITWSLSVEEQYYLIWPLLLLLSPRRILPAVLVVLITLNVAISAGVFGFLGITPFETEHLRFSLPTATYAPILIGSLLAFVLNQPAGFTAISRIAGSQLSALVAVCVLTAALILLPQDVRGLPNLIIHLMMAYLLAAVVLSERNVLAPVLTWMPVKRIGQISYGIYLYHLIALHIANKALPASMSANALLVFVCYFAVSIIIAELSFRYYETPFLRLRHRPRKSVPAQT